MKEILLRILEQLNIIKLRAPTANGQKVLEFCLKHLDKSFGNQYVDLGCAEEVNAIANYALGFQIGGGVSTRLMYLALQNRKRFLRVPEKYLVGGEIIISPTGYGNGNIANGHVGLYLGNQLIGSNDSHDGKFKRNYSIRSWKDRYVIAGGFPMEFYRIL